MSILKGVGFQFDESMAGYLGKGETDPAEGAAVGRHLESKIRFDVQITISDLNRFLKVSQHEAELSGTVTCDVIGGTFTIFDGKFNLFSLETEMGMRQMVYSFRFRDADNQTYYFHGHKKIEDDPGKLDVVEDMTRLFTIIYRGEDEQAPIYGAGELYFKLSDGPSMISSMKVLNATSLWQKVAAYSAFTSFAYGALRSEYLKDMRMVYDTRYENLVLSGFVRGKNGIKPFFFVSGMHDKGFPWGDGETFWDVMLVVGDEEGNYQRYCITDRILEGLELDVEHGTYRYNGPLFAIKEGFSTSLLNMRSSREHLIECEAKLEIDFNVQPHDTVPFPFPVVGKLVRKLSKPLMAQLREALPAEHPLGIHITPHTVSVRSGTLLITKPVSEGAAAGSSESFEIIDDRTFGEAERSTFRNIKEPTLLYGYICSVQPAAQSVRIQIHSRTLRDEREHWGKDRLDAYLGAIVSRTASAEMLMEGGRLTLTPFSRSDYEESSNKLFVKLGDPIIEINNDHYPTAVFQRRIVKVRDPSGKECLALEEDVSRITTGFDKLVEDRLAASNKSRADFSIVIKPNFMFAYNKRDQSTYTDPELVGHLVKRLRQAGFESIAVVEAQSTYGEYFDRRSVCEMAEYRRHLGSHLGNHPVSAIWSDADFRISFAKNKTHAYAYYTLTLKNIYGALPLANKFKEYHCARDIYHTAIEYLIAFPVHFGLVDAYLSADGPFGIFADTCPNPTHTIIAGADLVAVDWVAATKMGIDPMISQYMPLAVKAIGKPEIQLVGDASMYRPWLNVPEVLTLFTHKGVDADYYFGNLVYTSCAHMDKTHFTHKSRAIHIRLLRKLTIPIRNTFFVRTNESPTWTNRLASWMLYKLGY